MLDHLGTTATDYAVDILAQQPLLKLYTQITLCYPLQDTPSHSAIIETLEKGLEQLATSFPWVTGQIVNEGANEGDTGVFKIKPLGKVPPLVVKDLQNDPSAPTMDGLRRASFPASMLDESIVAPRRTVPLPSEPFDLDPVFLVQATFITGGLLLTFVGHHMAMDMTGQGHLIRLFSKACCNEPFTDEELSSGNIARDSIIPLLDESYQPSPELARQILRPPPSNDVVDHQAPPPKSAWAYITFSSASLAELKALAMKTLASGFVSTDDTLSAFIWQAITRARLPRLNLNTESTFGRAVNVRSYLGVSDTYPGLLQDMTFNTLTLQQLINRPLGSVASQLRSSLDPKALAHHVRALATLFSRTPDKSAFAFGASIDMAHDMMLSSWAKIDCYKLDFKLGLGKPECVRRPQFIPLEGLMYLMPRSLDGEIALLVCLRDEDMERLKMDGEFAKYGTYIG